MYIMTAMVALYGFFLSAEQLLAVHPYEDVLKAISSVPGEIEFDNKIKDFGEVERGQLLTHEFKFKNIGKGNLIVQGIHSSCGCMALEIDEGKVYQPGEGGTISVQLNSTSFSGKLSKTVMVLTNQRSKSVRVLTLRAHVKNNILVNPPLVDYGTLSAGQVAHRKIKISSASETPLEITGLRHGDNIESQLLKESDKSWLLDVYVKPTDSGVYKDILYLKTSLKHLPHVPVPIVGEFLGTITFSPEYIEFGAVQDSKFREKILSLKGINDFKILKAEVTMEVNGNPVDSKDYMVLDLPTSAGSEHKMGIKLHNKDKLSGAVNGDIRVLTDDPSQESIEIDFFAFFQS